MDLRVVNDARGCADTTEITPVYSDEVKIKEEVFEQSDTLCEDTSVSYATTEVPVHSNVSVGSSIVTVDQHKSTYFKTEGPEVNYHKYFKQEEPANQSEYQMLNAYSMDQQHQYSLPWFSSQNMDAPGVSLMDETIEFARSSGSKLNTKDKGQRIFSGVQSQLIKPAEHFRISLNSPNFDSDGHSSVTNINRLPVGQRNLDIKSESSLVWDTTGSLMTSVDNFISNPAMESSYAITEGASGEIQFMQRDIEDKKAYVCSQCPYRCEFRSRLVAHLRRHSGEKPFACVICSYRCSHKNSIIRHVLGHSYKKPYACSQCSFRCDRQATLSKHVFSHNGEKPYECALCSFRCSTNKYLNRHIRRHTGEKRFSCFECSYLCNNSSDLARHIRSHSGEKPFACTYCSYRCGADYTLTRHMRRHTNEKPYACLQCWYRCKTESGLIAHVARHTGEKIFACTQCSYRSDRKGHLSTHMLSHTGEKPFVCAHCPFRCSRKNNITRHVLSHAAEQSSVAHEETNG